MDAGRYQTVLEPVADRIEVLVRPWTRMGTGPSSYQLEPATPDIEVTLRFTTLDVGPSWSLADSASASFSATPYATWDSALRGYRFSIPALELPPDASGNRHTYGVTAVMTGPGVLNPSGVSESRFHMQKQVLWGLYTAGLPANTPYLVDVQDDAHDMGWADGDNPAMSELGRFTPTSGSTRWATASLWNTIGKTGSTPVQRAPRPSWWRKSGSITRSMFPSGAIGG